MCYIFHREKCPIRGHKKRTKMEKHQNKKKQQTSCDTCARLIYDEDYEGYVCDVDMDEDEYMRFMSDKSYSCPYYRNGDEYAVVRKQM